VKNHRNLLFEGNPKYALILSLIMYMVVVLSLVGYSAEIGLGIFAGDLLLLVTSVLFAQEIRKIIKEGDGQDLLRSESPSDWLKSSTLIFLFSALSSLVYALVSPENLGIGNNPTIEYLLYLSVGSLVIGLFYTVRIIWFTIDPSSRGNILLGKGILRTAYTGFRVIVLVCIGLFQIVNGIMLYLYLYLDIHYTLERHYPINLFGIVYVPALVLSFGAMFPIGDIIAFHFKDQIHFRDGVILLCYFLPWIVLIGYTLLLTAGIL
jgi:hypothetical protein